MKTCSEISSKFRGGDGCRRISVEESMVEKDKRSCGFALIEALASMVVFTVLVLGAASMARYSGTGILSQQFKREAVVAAGQAMDELWNLSYSQLKSAAGSSAESDKSVNGRDMPCTVSVEEEAVDDRGCRYIQISITINHDSSDDSVSLTGRRYALGLSKAAVDEG